jgi:parvulin-like peptidyl-prolyl isomerase
MGYPARAADWRRKRGRCAAAEDGTMSATKTALLAGAAFAAGIAVAAGEWTTGAAFAADPPSAASAKTLHVVATVNGEPITREKLADELIEDHGPSQLDLMINRKIVEQECKKAKVEVSDKEVDQDIENTLTKLRMKRKEFVETVLARQGMTFAQYRRDRVWPKIAMVKLVKDKVKVTDEDLKKAFEANYGAKVECRMIAVKEMNRAQELWERLMKEEKGEKRLKLFEDMVKEYSVDAATRSLGGKVQPFNKHSSNPELEKTVFALKEGELSSIMHVADANMIFLCVAHLPPVEGVTMDSKPNPNSKETIKQLLYEGIFTKMLQYEADQVFADARKKTRIENFMTGEFSAENAHIATQPPKEDAMKR